MSDSICKKNLSKTNGNKLICYLKIIFGIALVSILAVSIFYFINFGSELSSKHEDWGTFGDFLGGTLNPLLSFLALVALLLTIILQSQELEATRVELRRSAEAQEKSEIALKKQSEILNKQQFETTFFSFLELHNSSLEKLKSPSDKRVSKKSDLEEIRETVLSGQVTILQEAKIRLEEKNDLCGHYFRVLYQLLKFIATNLPGNRIGTEFKADDILDQPLIENEKMYSNMVRSFLSYDILQILSINCFCQDESCNYWKFKLLIDRYEFLEHMPFEINNEDSDILIEVIPFYSKAFGDNVFPGRNKDEV